MAEAKPSIAFIGLGAMGFGMALNLVKRGYPVTGYDIWPPALERFRAAGGHTASSPSQTVANKPFCICMVATAEQAQSVLLSGPDPAVPAMPYGAVLILSSTVSCDYVRSLDRQLHSLGRGDIFLIDSPVSGGAARAAEGTLSIMAGMSEEALDKVRPLLAEMADPKKLYVVQGGVGAGSNMKMVHQVLAACQILAASEVMGFAERLGLDLVTTQKAVLQSDTWNWMFEHRTPRMLTHFQPVASAVNIITKDTSIITAEGRRRGFLTPMTSVAEQVYFCAIGRGFGPDDDSSLIRLYTESKGAATVNLSETEEEKLGLVMDLMTGILICSVGEALAFASAVDLDLEQVFDLCVNAAGASTILGKLGPSFIAALRAGVNTNSLVAKDSEGTIGAVVERLQRVLETAQQLKVPLFLGSQAFHILQRALRVSSPRAALCAVVSAWVVQ